MTPTTINQLIAGIGGGHVTAFFLVLARVAPLFWVAPMFSSKLVPGKVKVVVAIALSIGLTPVAAHGQPIPGGPLEVAGLIAEGMLVGLGFAFILALLTAAVQAAGTIIDAVSGMSLGGMLDPVNGAQGGVLTQAYSLVGLLIFIAIGGDAWMLRGLGRTFQLVPLTRGPNLTLLSASAVQTFGQVFVSAVELAAPAMLALTITDVSFGMVSRVMPQLNLFAVGFPVKIGVGLLVFATTLPFLGGWISDQMVNSVGSALHALRVA
ncbi:MAG TPA: flagellar biosynthetic protein FliR [Solirubrobacteraceae bacterium]|nr:flagellar biosynthetic protein FliR [Solirubrobacteraceae bacterium]